MCLSFQVDVETNMDENRKQGSDNSSSCGSITRVAHNWNEHIKHGSSTMWRLRNVNTKRCMQPNHYRLVVKLVSTCLKICTLGLI